ncbi:MAG: IPT/TIG domain-containing protein [Bacteroidota bacterium]
MSISNAHLPVIADPGLAAGSDPSSIYTAGAQATAVFNDLDGIEYTFDTLTTALQVFCMFNGMVTYIPPNTTYTPTVSGLTVNSQITTGAKGGVLTKLLVLTDNALMAAVPNGVPSPVYILIEGVEPASFRSDIAPDMGAVPDPILDATWSETESSDPATIARPVKESKFLDRLMLGEKEFPRSGSKNIGLTELNGSNHPNFKIKMYFTESQSGGTIYNIDKISPLSFIKLFPTFIDVNPSNTSYISKWNGHPLVTSVTSFNESTVKAYIKFEVWNPNPSGTTDIYVPVDSGLTVKMMEYDPVSPNDVVATSTTDSNGAVSFSVAIPTDGWMGGNPDFFFTIENPAASAASGLGTLPTSWSTKGSGSDYWLSVQGAKGYYESFDGHTIGAPNNPLVFRIGVDFHLIVQHVKRRFSTPIYEEITDGITIELHDSPPTATAGVYSYSNPLFSAVTTNSKGEIHGVVYDLEPNEDIYWRVAYGVEDSSIGLNSSIVEYTEVASIFQFEVTTRAVENELQLNNQGHSEYTTWDDFKNFQRPTIGSNARPIILQTYSILDDQPRFALYTLKITRELAHFYHNMTNGNYYGIKSEYVFSVLGNLPKGIQESNNMTAHAVPLDVVQMTDRPSQWDRDMLIHESSHHVYWHAVDYTTMDIIGEFFSGDLKLRHYGNLLYNNEQAIIEGFPEAIEHIFSGGYYTYYNFRDENNNLGFSLGPSSAADVNRGEEIEGIFANAVTEIFWELVVNPHFTSHSMQIRESSDGDITTNNAWITNTNIRNNFVHILWTPLQNLINSPNDPNATEYFAEVISNNASIAHKLRGILNSFNAGVVAPSITNLSTNTGPAAGGTVVTITGTNFIEAFTNRLGRDAELKIKFGSFFGTNLNVINSTTLEITTPAVAASTVNVEISLHLRGFNASTTGGSSTRGAAMQYTIPGPATLPFTFT